MTRDLLLDLLRKEKIIRGLHLKTDVGWSFDEANLNQIEDFIFEDCIFESSVFISGLSHEDQIVKFENCEFHNSLKMIDFNCFDLVFSKSKIFDVLLLDSKFSEINIDETSVDNSLQFINIQAEDCYVTADKNSPINEIIVSGKPPQNIELITNDSVNTLILRSADKVSITGDLIFFEIDTNSCNHISYENITDKEKMNLAKFVMSDKYFTGNLFFESVNIDEMQLSNISCNEGSVRFNELIIRDAQFVDININSFFWNQIKFLDRLKIERCNFSQLSFSNIDWLFGSKLSDSFLDKHIPLFYGIRKSWLSKDRVYDNHDLIALSYERETYRQLKAASTANQNHIEALDFYKNEMRLYWKEVRISGRISWTNRVIIFLNRWFSDFGQSWLLPVIWLICINTFYMFYWQGIHISFCLADWGKGFLNILFYMNPAREFLDTSKVGTTVAGFDILIRVINAFLLFHFVRATRKYGKFESQ
jgi:hypothetical protein